MSNDQLIVAGMLDECLDAAREKRGILKFLHGDSIRLSLLVTPTPKQTMRAVYMYPHLPEYQRFRKNFEVPQYDPVKVRELELRLEDARRNSTDEALEELEASIKEELESCQSLSGYVFMSGGLVLYPDLRRSGIALSRSLVRYLPSKERGKYMIRSAAAIRLDYGEQPLGVLLLCDTAAGGFTSADVPVIRMMASLITPFVAMGLRDGLLKAAA